MECLIATRSAAANRQLRRHQEVRRCTPVLTGYDLYLRRRICKRFGATYYEGTVEYYNPREKLYRVNYDDGDSEDLSEAHLIPLLISTGAVTSLSRPANARLTVPSGTIPNGKRPTLKT